jgi:hypothetical protein
MDISTHHLARKLENFTPDCHSQQHNKYIFSITELTTCSTRRNMAEYTFSKFQFAVVHIYESFLTINTTLNHIL